MQQLKRSNTNFTALPKSNSFRTVSYNITVDFFDKESDPKSNWPNRRPHVISMLKNINPDVLCLQELSPEQCVQIYDSLKADYNCVFLSQTPSDVETGLIVCNDDVKQWVGKFMGTMIIGIFYKIDYKLFATNRFWLNENPHQVPINRDRSATDKGFGNMNTYRAVLWVHLIIGNTDVFVFNSHYPLSGNNKTRLECAKLESEMIKKIAGSSVWFSTGDKNLIPRRDPNDVDEEDVYHALVNNSFDARDSNNHYGLSTTWLGFDYDMFKNPIGDDGDMVNPEVLDILFSNLKSVRSFHHPGYFDETGLLGLDTKITTRMFASDHCLIGGDYIL